MKTETKSNLFAKEIARITDPVLADFTVVYLEKYVPDYFWEIGASSSGKFHPTFSQGEGGLVRHTKAVCEWFEQFKAFSPYCYMDEWKINLGRVACIVHDTAKYGVNEYDKTAYPAHAFNATSLVNNAWKNEFDEDAPYLLTSAIKSHMGQWSTDPDDRPFTTLDRWVHLADFIASRNILSMPDIETEYYNAIETELPF